jgi:Biotin-lipoyl like
MSTRALRWRSRFSAGSCPGDRRYGALDAPNGKGCIRTGVTVGSRARGNAERDCRPCGAHPRLVHLQVYYRNPRTDDAYVHANTGSVAVHVSGQIIRPPINDNQRVKGDDLLFVVDSRPYKLALDTARTKLNLTEIEIKTR